MEEDKEREPLTYGSVLRLIEERGGPEGLNLRGMNLMGIEFLPNDDLHSIIFIGANLRRARFLRTNLQGAIFTNAKLEKADLGLANLQKANLTLANLEEAHFENADLQEANLTSANLQKADLSWANLSKARLYNAQISQETRLENVNWGPKYILGEEEDKELSTAADVYRKLKQWHTNAGMYDTAGKFYYREMEARRKSLGWWLPRREWWLRWWPLRGEKVRLNIYRWLCGYGERPLQVFLAAALVIFGLAGFYYWLGSFASKTFPNCLYYSAASFTALGYGQWAPQPSGWAKGMGAAEAVIGVFMMALFLVTFTRKMVR